MATFQPVLTSAAPPPPPARACRGWGRGLRRGLAATGAALLIAVTVDSWTGFGRRPDGERRRRMERSPQWREGRFHNVQPLWSDNWSAALASLKPSPHARPAEPVSVAPVDPARFEVPPASGLRITWLGHSTTLMEIDGHRVLTDPVWGGRASPVDWVGVPRWYAPPLKLEQLPAIDVVVISHDHYDHLDHRTILALRDRATTFVVPLGVGAHLVFWGVPESRIVELDWWESAQVAGLRLTSTPARHASGRGLWDRDLTLWSGYVVAGAKHRVYFSGDTGMQEAFTAIADRLGPFDATMIEIGEYSPSWPDWHVGPEQAVAAHRLVRGGVLIPIHWGLFNLAPHTWTEPIERVLTAAAQAGVTVATPRPGEAVEVGAALKTGRWWPDLPGASAEQMPVVSTRAGERPAMPAAISR